MAKHENAFPFNTFHFQRPWKFNDHCMALFGLVKKVNDRFKFLFELRTSYVFPTLCNGMFDAAVFGVLVQSLH